MYEEDGLHVSMKASQATMHTKNVEHGKATQIQIIIAQEVE